MKTIYPIILKKAGNEYLVEIPDFNIMTQGKDLADAIDMARDAISLMGVDMQDDKKVLPAPSAPDKIHAEKDCIITLVDVDFDAYRRMLENKSVRKNCTIPAWLNEKAIASNINFSQVLQDALKKQLNL